MGTARIVAFVLGLLSGSVAQQRAEVFLCDDLAQRFTPESEKEEAVRALERFTFVACLLMQRDGETRRTSTGKLAAMAKSNRLLARGTAEEVALVKSMLAQLREEHLPRVRLECSLVTMPAALVKAHGLAANTFAVTDEIAFGKLVRAAVKQDGALQNLPEVTAETLVPFVVEPAARKDEPAPRADRAVRLRGEMVPLAEGEVAFALQFVREALPDDRTQLPAGAVQLGAFRIAAGKAVMTVTVAGEKATVLFVRCTEVTSEPPKEAKAGR